MEYSQGNKRIAVNTIIVYVRMVLVALISIITTRYVLKALGVSDFGLYNVVGGIVSMMSFFSIAMMTTTRRYINIEMGKAREGNLNKVFNVSLVLHIAFALMMYIIALTIGLWYIYNYLNVEQEKLSDAVFVFFVSTTISATGIVNVPFQALMTSFERFKEMAIIDLATTFLKIPLVILLLFYVGNQLRLYALGMCTIMFISLVAYHLYCKHYFDNIIKWKFYKEKELYKEILYFNNYTAMGAFAYLGRTNGSTMVINYFFGTITNGAYAIAIQIEGQIQNLVGNLSTAANPQLTQSYGAGDYGRSFDIMYAISRFGVLFMIVLCYSIYIELETLLGIWLEDIPPGAVDFSGAMLLSLFLRSLGGSVDSLLQATGKVKWYQISQSVLLIMGVPFAFLFFVLGFPAVYIIYAFIICDILRTIVMFIIASRVSVFSIKKYVFSVLVPMLKILLLLFAYYLLYNRIHFSSVYYHVLGFLFTLLYSSSVCLVLGLTKSEKQRIYDKFF